MDTSLVQGLREAGGQVKEPTPTPSLSFADRLRNLRQRLDLSQDEFATRFGLPVATIRNWEQGRRQNVGAAPELLISMIEKDPEGMTEMVSATI